VKLLSEMIGSSGSSERVRVEALAALRNVAGVIVGVRPLVAPFLWRIVDVMRDFSFNTDIASECIGLLCNVCTDTQCRETLLHYPQLQVSTNTL
jgi:hypothetical protein